MALLNTSLPNLIGGVSQQPDSVRFEGQCEEQTNAISSVVDGLSKRPNTRHIAKLIDGLIDENSFVHFINRTDSERYVAIIYPEYDSNGNHTHCKIRAFNIVNGTESSITVGGTTYNASFTSTELAANSNRSGTTYTLSDAQTAYLHDSAPRQTLKGLSIGDSTFLLNTTKSVAPKTTKTDAVAKEAAVVITQGDYEKDYRVNVNILPEGSTSQPSNLVLPTFAFTTSSYTHSSSTVNAYHDYTRYNKRHRISGVTITGAGSNIAGDISITVSSSLAIYTQPQFTVHVSNGSVSGVTINDGGSFEGSGVTTVSTGQSRAYRIVSKTYYGTPPTFSSSASGGYVGSATSIFAKESSGASTSGLNAKSNLIATDLKGHMDAAANSTDGGGFGTYFDTFIEGHGSTIYLPMKDAVATGNDFQIKTKDSLADTGMQAIYKQVDSITSLPVSFKSGFKVKVKGDAEIASDDYYVQFKTNTGSGYGEGYYEETVGFDIVKGYESNTMPFILKNNAVDSFVLEEGNYSDRVSGDDTTNPLPSFVGHEISNMFFFKNRLGFLSNDNIILSESGLGTLDESGNSVFNFSRTSVSSLLDSDPIDVSVASSRVTNLKSAKGFQENLIIFSENGQFVLKGGDILTPRTVSITPVTNFDANGQVEPIPLGAYLYFPFNRSGFTGVREYTVNASTDVYDSTEITEHIPAFIPENILAFAGTSAEDALAVVSVAEDNAAYVYRFFFNGQKKLLSSWFKFTFDGNIRGLSFNKSIMNVVLCRNNQTHLLEMPLISNLKDTGVNHNTYLDMRRSVSVAAGATTIDLSSFYTPTDNEIKVYTTDGALIPSTNSGATVTLTNGALSSTDATNVWVGIDYTMKYTFSKQLFKQASGQSKTPSAGGSMMLKNCSVFYNNTAHFDVKVTPSQRDTYTNTFNPNIINTTNIALQLDDGFFRVPVFSNSEDTTITIENSSALPSNFQSAEFEVNAHQRSRRF